MSPVVHRRVEGPGFFLYSILVVLWLPGCSTTFGVYKPCMGRDFGGGSQVCVCNSSYCDTIEPWLPMSQSRGRYVLYSTSKAGLRLERTIGWLLTKDNRTDDVVEFVIHPERRYQSIIGFGAAFTDAAGYNIVNLSEGSRDHLLRSYYGAEGIELNMGRVPMGCSQFSRRGYSYADVPGDLYLKHFALQAEDYVLKLPLIKKVNDITNGKLKLIGTPWTAPFWMKTNKNITGFGMLRLEYYQVWADYFVRNISVLSGTLRSGKLENKIIQVNNLFFFLKQCFEGELPNMKFDVTQISSGFLKEYRMQGVEFWGISTQNRPSKGLVESELSPSMGWTSRSMSQFISKYLGPTVHESPYKKLMIITVDDNRYLIPWTLYAMFKMSGMNNNETKKFVNGVGVQWYMDSLVPSENLDLCHELYPDLFIITTEAATGASPGVLEVNDLLNHKVQLGSWERAEQYAENIIENLNHWVSGWLDWNIALDTDGGPCWHSSVATDANIIINLTTDEFYKQPQFYAFGHFSKFISEGSVRIYVETETQSVLNVAFLAPDNSTIVILYNPHDEIIPVQVKTPASDKTIAFSMPERSIHTIKYWSS